MNLRTLTRPEGERLVLHYPAAKSPGPVIFFLAGTGSTAEWAADETRMSEAAPAAGFHLVVPEAQRPRPGEPAKFLSNPPRWNCGSPAPLPELQTHADDIGFLAATLDDLIRDGIADAKRVYFAGFSNGAGMVFRCACEFAQRLAAIAPIAGLWWPLGKTPGRPVPTLYALGGADPLIPYRGGDVHLPWGNRLVRRPGALQTLEAWAATIGCDPRSEIVHDADGVREEMFPVHRGAEFRAFFFAGHGHHWPGGRGQLNPRIAGPLTSTLDLNTKLFEFFNGHHL